MMGYAEFGGGGSVKWLVKHSDGRIKNDKDPKPATGGTLTIMIDGYQPIVIPIDKDDPEQVRITWPD